MSAGLLAGAAAVVVLIGGAYWAGHKAGGDSCASAVAREERLVGLASDAAASAAAAAITNIGIKHVHVRQQLTREVIERPVFRDCRSGDAAVRLFNSAIPPAGGERAADPGQLPASNAAR